MLGFSSGGILDCREHEPNPRITQITADELLATVDGDLGTDAE
jgi:hypothetical protein